MKILLLICTTLLLLLAGVALYAPHLKTLIREGYPASVWPANGYFAEVAGSRSPVSDQSQNKIKGKKLLKLLNNSNARAMMIDVQGNQPVEYYATGYDKNSRFNSFSAVKSLVGILVFKAVSEKKISSLHAPIGQYIPEITDKNLKSQPIQSFLDMKSGILFETGTLKTTSGFEEKDMEQTLANPFGPMARLHAGGIEDIWQSLISSPERQGKYNYQNINTALLGMLLEKVYDKPLHKLLSEKLWRPSGAQTAHWRKYNKDQTVSAYCCLYAGIRDWVSVARYIMNNGKPDQPFLDEDLWKRFMGQHLSDKTLSEGHYKNHTRYNILDRPGEPLKGSFTYFLGQGGQIIYMMPQHKLVVVRFGKKHQLLHSTLYEAWKE